MTSTVTKFSAQAEPLEHSSSLAGRWPGSGGTDRAILIQTATLGVCIGCLVVGILGLKLRYPRVQVPGEPLSPVVAQTIRVDLPAPPPPAARVASPAPAKPQNADPPPPADLPTPPAAPPVAVALPSPSIFAKPVEGPHVVVDAKYAVPPRRSQPPPPSPVKHLVFGVGEGQQPDPEYPDQAIKEHQQGTVTIQFTVGENGRVLAAEVTKPSRWPLLNQAALRKIRDSWTYAPGPLRTYDISYEFKLSE
jgi:periplasmic protein TonB